MAVNNCVLLHFVIYLGYVTVKNSVLLRSTTPFVIYLGFGIVDNGVFLRIFGDILSLRDF